MRWAVRGHVGDTSSKPTRDPCPQDTELHLRQSTKVHLLLGLGIPRGLPPFPYLHLEVTGQLAPHRDDGVALALLGQVADTTHEQPVGGDIGLAGLDHATA